MAATSRSLPRLRRAFARAEDRYLLVLIMIIASLLVTALAADSTIGRFAVVVVVGGTFIQTLRTSGWQPRTVRVGLALVVGLVAISAIVSTATEGDRGAAFLLLVSLCLVLIAISAIIRRLAQLPQVTMKTVLGALSIYLYVGLFFAIVYGLVDVIQAAPFFVQTDDATSLEYVYFSIVTMTTVGYGDYSAAGNLGRMLAVTEALFGQLYMVSVVAILVGNLGRKVPRMRLSGATGPDDDEPTGDTEGAGGEAPRLDRQD